MTISCKLEDVTKHRFRYMGKLRSADKPASKGKGLLLTFKDTVLRRWQGQVFEPNWFCRDVTRVLLIAACQLLN